MVVSMAISGPLVDKVLYRYFVGENLLTHIFGVGKSASMGFLITVAGIIVVVAAIVGSMNPLVLAIESTNSKKRGIRKMNNFGNTILNVFAFNKILIEMMIVVSCSLFILNELLEFEVKNAKSK